ncbi:MAG: Na+/H+ antiporter subunit E [Paracoccaceae bacterium]|nr:Na+/H+ antiporter subunit E [Paracoccaceae bacterium]
MNVFATNIVLAVIWATLMGEITVFNLVSGFALGFVSLWVVQPLTGASSYFFRVYAWVRLVVMFHYELIVSSVAVAWDVVTPRHRARPAIIDVPLDVKSDAGLLLVTNLISLTPGTLSLDVSDDRKTLKVHAMFADDPEGLRRVLKSGMERWVIDAVEGGP